MIGRHELDLSSEHCSSEIINRHLRRRDGILSAQVTVGRPHVGKDTNPERLSCLCKRNTSDDHQASRGDSPKSHTRWLP
jgi:type III secretory pathway lipoprotein EscJ